MANPDLNGQLNVAKLCAKRVAVGAGTQTFAGVDLRDFINNVKIIVAHTEFSGSGTHSIQYSLQDSADNATFAATAGLPTVAANTAADTVIEFALDTRNCRRYVQLKALTASTTATYDIGAVAVGLKAVN